MICRISIHSGERDRLGCGSRSSAECLAAQASVDRNCESRAMQNVFGETPKTARETRALPGMQSNHHAGLSA